jgi:hypothetical protein
MMGNKKLSKVDKKVLAKTADHFLSLMKEKVSIYLLTEDFDALGRLVEQMDILSGYEVLKTLRDKGMSKEITELCDKAGKQL